VPAPASRGDTIARLRPLRQPETGQRHACEAEAEFLQRSAARDRLGYTLREFVEFIIHSVPLFPFSGFSFSLCLKPLAPKD
jgi:hypothetical protein